MSALTTPTVTMPRLSDSMEEGTIVRWLCSEGAEVNVGDDLVEIETDKATVVYEAETAGVLRIEAQVGATVRVGATIAHIGDLGQESPPPADDGSRGRRPKASPVARRLAQTLGVALESLAGSGPNGRIVKDDVMTAAQADAASARADATGAAGAQTERVSAPDTQPLTGASTFERFGAHQATVARRMTEAKSTMPDFTLTTEVDMEAAAALRDQIAQLSPAEKPPSFGDFVIKACALALREHSRVNASYREGGVERHGRINVGVAVAAEEALFVATVLDADTKSLGQIAAEVRTLAERARGGRLTPAEMSGATFTVSNLGMFGVSQFTAVLNPPQAAILAVGSVDQRVVAHEGAPAVRLRMTVTLTCDHRVLYGADAAAFLASVRANLEQPLRLVVQLMAH